MKRGTRWWMALAFAGALIGAGCSKAPNAPPAAPVSAVEVDDRIILTDLDGKEWDITHAVRVYGFDPDRFEYGLGVGMFPAVMDPSFVVAGEGGFPDPYANRMVIGANFGGDTRAYAIDALARREVINDRFGDQYVAVGY
jgi:hypothetical protein